MNNIQTPLRPVSKINFTGLDKPSYTEQTYFGQRALSAKRQYDERKKAQEKEKAERIAADNARIKRNREIQRRRYEREKQESLQRRRKWELENEQEKRNADDLYNKQVTNWIDNQFKKVNIDPNGVIGNVAKFVGIRNKLALVAELKNAIGSLAESSIEVNGETIFGKKTEAELKIKAAQAHDKLVNTRKQYKDITDQIQNFEEQYLKHQDYINNHKDDPSVKSILEQRNLLHQTQQELKQQLNDPTLVGLDDSYKEFYVKNKRGIVGNLWELAKQAADPILKGWNPQRLRQYYKNKVDEEYNNYLGEDMSKNPKDHQEVERGNTKSMIKQANAEIAVLQKDYEDNRNHLRESKRFWDVMNGYKKETEAHQNDPLYNPLYWRYEMAPMIGSSMSSPSQAAGTILKTAATVGGTLLAPYTGGVSLAALPVSEIAATPLEIAGGFDENYAEIATRRAENVQALLKDDLTKTATAAQKGYDSTISELKKRDAEYWKSQGWSDKEIKDYLEGDEGDKNAIRDHLMGFTSSGKFKPYNNPQFQDAVLNSMQGLQAQFQGDNARTMYDIAFQKILLAAAPLKWLKSYGITKKAGSTVKAAISNTKNAISNAKGAYLEKYGTKEQKVASMLGKNIDDYETSSIAKAAAKPYNAPTEAAAETTVSKYRNGFRKPQHTTKDAVKKGWRIGSEAGEMTGTGVVGHMAGGALGVAVGTAGRGAVQLAKKMLPARTAAALESIADKAVMKYHTVLNAIYGNAPLRRTLTKYGLKTLGSQSAVALNESYEEAVQSLNSKKDFGSEYGFAGGDLGSLLINDAAQGGRVFDAYMAMLGIGESPLANDMDFLAEARGGAALGFFGLGNVTSVVNVGTSINDVYKEYQANKLLYTPAILNREYSKKSRAANAIFAKMAMRGNSQHVMEAIEDMENRDRYSEDPTYSQEDYDERKQEIRRVMSMTNDTNIRKLMEQNGIKYNTDEYATAIADLANIDEARRDNNKQRKDVDSRIQNILASDVFKNAIDQYIDKNVYNAPELERQRIEASAQKELHDRFINRIEQAEEQVMRKLLKVEDGQPLDKNSSEYRKMRRSSTFTRRMYEHSREIKQSWEDEKANINKTLDTNFRRYTVDKIALASELRALLRLKNRHNKIDSFFNMLQDRFNLKAQRPDAATIRQSINERIDLLKHKLSDVVSQTVDEFDTGLSDTDMLKHIESMDIAYENSELDDLFAHRAMLDADKKVTDKYYNTFTDGIVYHEGKPVYNPTQRKKEDELDKKIKTATNSGNLEQALNLIKQRNELEYDSEGEVKERPTSKALRRVRAIMQAEQDNNAIDHAINDIASGDFVTKLYETFEEEEIAANAKANSNDLVSDDDLTRVETATTSTQETSEPQTNDRSYRLTEDEKKQAKSRAFKMKRSRLLNNMQNSIKDLYKKFGGNAYIGLSPEQLASFVAVTAKNALLSSEYILSYATQGLDKIDEVLDKNTFVKNALEYIRTKASSRDQAILNKLFGTDDNKKQEVLTKILEEMHPTYAEQVKDVLLEGMDDTTGSTDVIVNDTDKNNNKFNYDDLRTNLEKDQENVDKDVSGYFDVVTKGDGNIYPNRFALNNYTKEVSGIRDAFIEARKQSDKFNDTASSSNAFINYLLNDKSITAISKSERNNITDQQFKQFVGSYFKYKDIPGIEDVFTRALLSLAETTTKNDNNRNTLKVADDVKNAICSALSLKSPNDALKYSLDKAFKYEHSDQYISEIATQVKNVAKWIEQQGYSLIDVYKNNIYGFVDGIATSCMLDILAVNEDGDAILIDVYVTKGDLTLNKLPLARTEEMLSECEKILQQNYGIRNVTKYILPLHRTSVDISFSGNTAKDNIIPISENAKQDEDLSSYKVTAKNLVNAINETIDKINSSLTDKSKTIAYEMLDEQPGKKEYKNYIDALQKRLTQVQNDLSNKIGKEEEVRLAQEEVLHETVDQADATEFYSILPYLLEYGDDLESHGKEYQLVANACAQLDYMVDRVKNYKISSNASGEKLQEYHKLIEDFVSRLHYAQKLVNRYIYHTLPASNQQSMTQELRLIYNAIKILEDLQHKKNTGISNKVPYFLMDTTFINLGNIIGSYIRDSKSGQHMYSIPNSINIMNAYAVQMEIYIEQFEDMTEEDFSENFGESREMFEFYGSVMNHNVKQCLDNATLCLTEASKMNFDRDPVFASSYRDLQRTLPILQDIYERFTGERGMFHNVDDPWYQEAQADINEINALVPDGYNLKQYTDPRSPYGAFYPDIFAMQNGSWQHMSKYPDLLDDVEIVGERYVRDPKAKPTTNKTIIQLFRKKDGTLCLYIEYNKAKDKTTGEPQKQFAYLPFTESLVTPDGVKRSGISEKGMENLKIHDEAIRRLVQYIKIPLDYVIKNPAYVLSFSVDLDRGTITYDGDNFHPITEFAFADKENDHNLFDIQVGTAHRIGFVSQFKQGEFSKKYTITNADLKTSIGFTINNTEADNRGIMNGNLVYFYAYDKNPKHHIPLKIENAKAAPFAEFIATLVGNMAAGDERTKEGFKITDLLDMLIYTKEHTLDVGYGDGVVQLNGERFENINNDMVQRKAFIEAVSKLYTTVTAEIANKRLGDLAKESGKIYSKIYQLLKRSGKNEIQLPNGLTFTVDDFEHDGHGSTVLGYMFRNNLLGTSAVGRGYRQLYIKDIKLVKAADINKPVIKPNVQEEISDVASGSDLDFLFMTTKSAEGKVVNRTKEEVSEYEKLAKQYFKQVFGDDAGVMVSRENTIFLRTATETLSVLGYCTSKLAVLSQHAPEEAIWHEAFHRLMELVLPANVRDEFYERYKAKFGNNLTDVEVAEGLTDLFVNYRHKLTTQGSTKWYTKLLKWFKVISAQIDLTKQVGFRNALKLGILYYKFERGKYKGASIAKENIERFVKKFGDELHYEYNGVKLNNFSTSDDMHQMAKALSYYIVSSIQRNDPYVNFSVTVDDMVLNHIPEKTRKQLMEYGNNSSTPEKFADVRAAYKEIFESAERIKKGKDGKEITETYYPKFVAIQREVANNIAALTGDYEEKFDIENTVSDGYEEDEQGKHIDKFDSSAYEFNRLSKAGKKVKMFLATIPYMQKTDGPGGIGFVFTKNKYLSPQYIPMQQVFNDLVENLNYCTSVEEFEEGLKRLAEIKPEYKYILGKYSKLLDEAYGENRNRKAIRYSAEALAIQILLTVRSQKIDFIYTLGQDDTRPGEKRNKRAKLMIKHSNSDRDRTRYASSWQNFLKTGQSGMISPIQTGGILRFSDAFVRIAANKNPFQAIADELQQISKFVNIGENEVSYTTFDGQQVRYNRNSAVSMRALKNRVILLMNYLGIQINIDSLNDYINSRLTNNLRVDVEVDEAGVIGKWLSDANAQVFYTNIAKFAKQSDDGSWKISANGINAEENLYSKSSFVQNTANWHSDWYRKCHSQMSYGFDSKKLYEISQNSGISHILKQVNSCDETNEYLNTQCGFNYNLSKDENGREIGSLVFKNRKHNKIHAMTYIGSKGNMRGDKGTEYSKQTFVDDYYTKLEALSEGYFVFPTLSDKSTYLMLSGIDFPGLHWTNKYGAPVQEMMLPSKEFGGLSYNFTMLDEQSGDTYRERILIPNVEQVDQMIEYAKTEMQAIESCIEFMGSDKCNEKTMIQNYHTSGNGQRFWSLTELWIPKKISGREDGARKWDVISLNNKNKTPKELLKLAKENFFDLDIDSQRFIMICTMHQQVKEELKKSIDLGLITAGDVYKNHEWTRTLMNKHLNRDKLELLENAIEKYYYGKEDYLPEKERTSAQDRHNFCGPIAIQWYITDVLYKSVMSAEETLRVFAGHPGQFKVRYDKDGYIEDSTFDIQKRIGGLVSTGDDNAQIQGLSMKYRCAEVKDYEISSSADAMAGLDDMFKTSQVNDIFDQLVLKLDDHDKEVVYKYFVSIGKVDKVSMGVDDGIIYVLNNTTADEKRAFAEEFDKLFSTDMVYKIDSAVQKVHKMYTDYLKDDAVNVADGAAYISADMCERMLRTRGVYSGKVKQAFELLKNGTGWMSSAEAYKIIYDEINVVSTKYTAYGFRPHLLANGDSASDGYTQVSPMAVAYYYKFALFPIFDCIATGPMDGIYKKMQAKNVDMMLMTSAVKVGSQGAVKFNGKEIPDDFNVYEQDLGFIRRQLETDPEEGFRSQLGSQMLKIALQNLRTYRSADGKYPYIAPDGRRLSGQQVLDNIMKSIEMLSSIGEENLLNKLSTNGEIDETKLAKFLYDQLSGKGANQNQLKMLKTTDGKMKIPLAASCDASWIESIVHSQVYKKVIGVSTPGTSYIQRSVFATEGSEAAKKLYNGKPLMIKNNKNSMDCVLSMDFFDNIFFKQLRGKSFDQKRKWLIDNGIIGEDAEPLVIGYRIPTQAISSISALRCVDVIAATKTTVVLPKEFTKITGSDFDIDHLYLATYNFQIVDGKVTRQFDPHPTKKVKRKDDSGNEVEVEIRDINAEEKYWQNELLNMYMTTLTDHVNSGHLLLKSIDNDTVLPKSVADQIEPTGSTKRLAYNFGSLHEQTDRKNDYITGKFGIGPFALNVTNTVLTQLYNVTFRKDDEFAKAAGIQNFNLYIDNDGDYVSSWMSAFINAHVDIVKDPWISKLCVNTYTYNMLNLLIRAGFGEAAVWFVSQPIIKELAMAKEKKKTRLFQGTEDSKVKPYVKAFTKFGLHINKKEIDYIRTIVRNPSMAGVIGDYSEESTNRREINDERDIKEYGGPKTIGEYGKYVHDLLTNTDALKYGVINGIQGGEEGEKRKQIQLDVYKAWILLEPYANALGDLVQYTKVDTKKCGKSFAGVSAYCKKYKSLSDPKTSKFDQESLSRLLHNSWINAKTNRIFGIPRYILGKQSFYAGAVVYKIVSDVCKMKNDYSEDFAKSVARAVVTALKQRYFVDYYYDVNGKTSETNINDLFFGENSINKQLSQIISAIDKNPKYKHLKYNELISQLYAVPSNIVEDGTTDSTSSEFVPSFITLKSNVDDSRLNEDDITRGWLSLLQDDNPEIVKFAKNLVIYAQLTSGEYRGWNNLAKFIPAEWISGEYNNDSQRSFAEWCTGLLTSDSYSGSIDVLMDKIMQNNMDGDMIVDVSYSNSYSLEDGYLVFEKNNENGGSSQQYVMYDGKLYSVLEQTEGGYIYGELPRLGFNVNGFHIYEYAFDLPEGAHGENNETALPEQDSEQVLPETSQQIDSSRIANVFFGTKENPQLSNFANRPFSAKFGKMESAKFYNVEQYFQATKMLYIRNYIEYKFGKDNPEVKQLSSDINNIIKEILATNSPNVAKEFGSTRVGRDLSVEIQNAISGYLSEHWDKYRAQEVMYRGIKKSFEQNESARNELVTKYKDSIFTHDDRKGNRNNSWVHKFPQLLTQVRDEFLNGGKTTGGTGNTSLNSYIQVHNGDWTREEAEDNNKTLYIFTDNTDRTSGTRKVDSRSPYARKYANGNTLYYPTRTQAVLRGLPNAMPISTQRWYHEGAKGAAGVWTDDAVEEFKSVVRAELQDIVNEFKTGKYDKIMVGNKDGFFNSYISDISLARCPKIYNALKELLIEFGMDSLVPKNDTAEQAQFDQKHLLDQSVLEDAMQTEEFSERAIEDFNKKVDQGVSLENAIKSVEPFFTQDELTEIAKRGQGAKVWVKSVSRHTDPVFFAKKFLDFVKQNDKKPMSDSSRFLATEIWTKHDGEPLAQILEACKKYRIAPMVSFSITGLGGGPLEPGVMKYNDLLDRIEALIVNGHLDPRTTTIRIDPILVGYTKYEDIVNIVTRCKSMGIHKFVTSVVQSYHYTTGWKEREVVGKNGKPFTVLGDRKVVSGINNALASVQQQYNWDEFYGKITQEDVDAWNKFKQENPGTDVVVKAIQAGIRSIPTAAKLGQYHHTVKPEKLKELANVLNELNQDPNIEIETCSFYIPGLKYSACLDPDILAAAVGTTEGIMDESGDYARNETRPECCCFKYNNDLLGYSDQCPSMCAYCYGGHSDDVIDQQYRYYDENGNLKDNIFTRVPTSNFKGHDRIFNAVHTKDIVIVSGGAYGGDTLWHERALVHGASVNNIHHLVAADNTQQVPTNIKYSAQMVYDYNGMSRPEVKSKSTFDAILNGERSATTRYASQGHLDDWKSLKVGDFVSFRSNDVRKLYVRITKEATTLTKDTDAEEWSKKEGWSTEYYKKEVFDKHINKNDEAIQIEYVLYDTTVKAKPTVRSKRLINEGISPFVVSEDRLQIARKELQKITGRTYNNDYVGNLQARDYYQAAWANAVYAIAPITGDKKGVKGGTNSAVQTSIYLNKPTYVLDIATGNWYVYSKKDGIFIETQTPTLSNRSALVGSRTLEKYSKEDKDGTYKTTDVLGEYIGDDAVRALVKKVDEVFDKTEKKASLYDKLQITEEMAIKAEEVKKHCKN